MIYGPPDLRRVGEYVRRICDGRRRIPLAASYARYRTARASNRNCAEAVALCALARRSGASVYNVAEERTYSQAEWIGKIGRVLGWNGAVAEIDDAQWPPPFGIDTRQEMIIDSSRIRAELGFREVIEPEEALKEAVCWAKDELEAGKCQVDVDYLKEDAVLNRYNNK
jgi:nucleoside-diphosphate-sugar epimerase